MTASMALAAEPLLFFSGVVLIEALALQCGWWLIDEFWCGRENFGCCSVVEVVVEGEIFVMMCIYCENDSLFLINPASIRMRRWPIGLFMISMSAAGLLIVGIKTKPSKRCTLALTPLPERSPVPTSSKGAGRNIRCMFPF